MGPCAAPSPGRDPQSWEGREAPKGALRDLRFCLCIEASGEQAQTQQIQSHGCETKLGQAKSGPG